MNVGGLINVLTYKDKPRYTRCYIEKVITRNNKQFLLVKEYLTDSPQEMQYRTFDVTKLVITK